MPAIVVPGRTVANDLEALATFVAPRPFNVGWVFELRCPEVFFEDLPLVVFVGTIEVLEIFITGGRIPHLTEIGIRQKNIPTPVS